MEKLNKVIAGLTGCIVGNCSNCEYGGNDCGRDWLMEDALELLKELKGCCEGQAKMILDLTKKVRAARAERNVLIREVEGLEQERNMSGDLISREALIRRIELIDWYDGKGSLGAANEESAYIRYTDVAKVIAEALAVEAEPVVHAHWVIERWSSGYIKRCSCSNCGNHPRDAYNPPKYCDNCGAHMDEEVTA